MLEDGSRRIEVWDNDFDGCSISSDAVQFPQKLFWFFGVF